MDKGAAQSKLPNTLSINFRVVFVVGCQLEFLCRARVPARALNYEAADRARCRLWYTSQGGTGGCNHNAVTVR